MQPDDSSCLLAVEGEASLVLYTGRRRIVGYDETVVGHGMSARIATRHERQSTNGRHDDFQWGVAKW